MSEFTKLNLSEPLVKSMVEQGYKTPTPIQKQSIPLVVEGHDLLGIAQTGTGKTAAFALPILNKFLLNPRKLMRHSTRCLVLAPTRELASQIAKSFETYGQFMNVTVMTMFGGVPIKRHMREIKNGVDVLVATPGRLLDMLNQQAMTLSHVEVLVLDEADQMLDLGFIHDLRKIVKLVPEERQTLFFSATMPKSISELAGKYLTRPMKVSVKPAATTAERVEQSITFISQHDKQALLTITLRSPDLDRALVFSRTKHGADKIVRHLTAAGIESAAIHGNKSQAQRERALDAFRTGSMKVLIATDIAARGIDVPGVSHVINYDLPNVPEQYVHRIGRTARANASGMAVSFCAKDEKPYLKDIEKVIRQNIPVTPLPKDFYEQAVEIQALPVAPKVRGNKGQPRKNKDGKPIGGGGGKGRFNKSNESGNNKRPNQRRRRPKAKKPSS